MHPVGAIVASHSESPGASDLKTSAAEDRTSTPPGSCTWPVRVTNRRNERRGSSGVGQTRPRVVADRRRPARNPVYRRCARMRLAARSLSSPSWQPESGFGHRSVAPDAGGPFVPGRLRLRAHPDRGRVDPGFRRQFHPAPNGKGGGRGLLPGCSADREASVSALDPRGHARPDSTGLLHSVFP